MYDHTHAFDLPLISLTFESITVPTEVTVTAHGIEFRFPPGSNPYLSGTITVRTDANEVTAIELGGPEIDDQLEVGDWGFAHMTIGPGSTDTIADLDLDAQTRDTIRSLIYSAMGYAQGHAARVSARLCPPIPAFPN